MKLERWPSPHQEPSRWRASRSIFGLPGRAHPAGLRPDHRLADPPHPRAPRAGRRPHGRGLRPRHRPSRRGHGDQRARRPPTSSRRCATPTWTRSRWSCITGQVPTAAIGTDAFQECDTIGITRSVTKHNLLVTDGRRTSRGSSARRSTSPPPVGPARCCVDIPKDIVDPKNPNSAMEWYWPTDATSSTLPGYQPDDQGPPAQDPGGGRADPARRRGR